MILDGCSLPIVLASLAGGSSTPELTAAVSQCWRPPMPAATVYVINVAVTV